MDIATNGREAVEAVRSLPYDLILMDLSMPEMDDFKTTSCIMAIPGEEAHTPIIAMTASSMKSDRENCLAYGMKNYISKPISKLALLNIVAKWIDDTKRAGLGSIDEKEDHNFCSASQLSLGRMYGPERNDQTVWNVYD